MKGMHLIRNKMEYEAALEKIDTLFDARPGTEEGEELDFLVALVEIYERAHFPMGAPDPVSAIKFRMEQLGLIGKDLIPCLGTKSKVSEVLSGKRPLSLNMIRRLHENLGIPAEILIQKQDAPVGREMACTD